MRQWKTHDLVDLFNSLKTGAIPLATKQFTNFYLSNDPQIAIKKLDPSWPQHMETDPFINEESEFKIETGIPLPPKQKRHDPKIVEAMKKLEQGQSFLIPIGENQKVGLASSRISIWAKKYCAPKLFATRSVRAENKTVGLRVWRLE